MSPALADAGNRSFATLHEATADAVAAGIISGDVDTLAHLFWTSLHGIVTLDLAGKLVHGPKKGKLAESAFRRGPSQLIPRIFDDNQVRMLLRNRDAEPDERQQRIG